MKAELSATAGLLRCLGLIRFLDKWPAISAEEASVSKQIGWSFSGETLPDRAGLDPGRRSFVQRSFGPQEAANKLES